MRNEPPRMGKSRTLVLFNQWILGNNNENRLMVASYNDRTSMKFSRYVRDGIQQTRNDPFTITFNDIFPNTKIKEGNAAVEEWALNGQHFNYLGSGLGGSLTGTGCTIGEIDDPIKNEDEAFNENVLINQWDWYTGTWLSRIEEGGLQIITMTRWASKDLCGRILESEDAENWYIHKMEAMNKDTGEMLCDELLSRDRYDRIKKIMCVSDVGTAVFMANYHQEPVDLQGCLYSGLKEYDEAPEFTNIINYTDTADEGKDFLCSICAGVRDGEAWILDVLYTDEAMEQTEPATADMLHNNGVRLARIESNSGGRGFARNIEKLLWEKSKNKQCKVDWFHQSQNKIARILTNSTFVINHIYFPKGWHYKWPSFYTALTTFQKTGKNKTDDGPDCLTGISEMVNGKMKKTFKMDMSGKQESYWKIS
jgi:predicted phage terminase large subunit-like protein